MAGNTHPRNERWIRGVTSKGKLAFVFARARRSTRRHPRDARVFVAEAERCGASPLVESQGTDARSGLDGPEAVRQSSAPRTPRSGSIARQNPRRGHGHVPLAAAAVAAVGMRMAGCQTRTQEIAKEVHGHLLFKQCHSTAQGTGRTRL